MITNVCEIHQNGVLYNSSLSRALLNNFSMHWCAVVLRIHDHIYEFQYSDYLSWSDSTQCCFGNCSLKQTWNNRFLRWWDKLITELSTQSEQSRRMQWIINQSINCITSSEWMMTTVDGSKCIAYTIVNKGLCLQTSPISSWNPRYTEWQC